MLGGLLSLRNYLAVSAVVAIILYIIQLLAGTTFVNAMVSLNRSARAAGMAQVLADAMTEPVRLVITPNSPLGAVVGGLLWPMLLLWLILLVFVVFFTVLGRGLGTAATTIR
jgi:uncharacterized protein YacL